MTPRDVADRLEGVERAELGWRALLDELHAMEEDGTLNLTEISQMQGRLSKAADRIAEHGERCSEVVNRCLKLAPCPATGAPIGF